MAQHVSVKRSLTYVTIAGIVAASTHQRNIQSLSLSCGNEIYRVCDLNDTVPLHIKLLWFLLLSISSVSQQFIILAMGYICTCSHHKWDILVTILLFMCCLFNCVKLIGSRVIERGDNNDRMDLVVDHSKILQPVIFVTNDLVVKSNSVQDNSNRNSDYGLSDENIQQIRHSLLRELGLETVPDVRKMNVSQEEYSNIYHKYAALTMENDAEITTKENSIINSPETKRIQRFFTFQSIETSNQPSNSITFPNTLHETVTEEHYGSTIEIDRATLRILIPGLQNGARQRVGSDDGLPMANIKIYQQLDSGVNKYVTEKLVYLSYVHPKWADIDVESALEFSLVNNASSVKFFVECDLCDRYYKLRVTDHKQLATLNVLVSLEKNRVHRSKRSPPAARKSPLRRKSRQNRSFCSNQNTTRCCRYPLEVTFKELESFEFIIEPKSYDAGYCKGHCPLRYNPANKHALIQSLVWKKDKRAPKPCCAPKKFASLKIIYLDKNKNMQVTTWPKMSVTDCACN